MIALKILDILASRQQKICTAESCTGGLLAVSLSQAPEATRAFLGSIIAYAEETKILVLGVRKNLITKYGVVSEEVAASMAQRAQEKFASDWAISTTGYAGPSGGTDDAPLGTIWVAI